MLPARRRLAFFSAALIALAAVLAVLLPAGIASAATVTAAGNRVWAISFTPRDRVGADRLVSADQRLGEPTPCPFYVSGSCVAPETGSRAIAEIGPAGNAGAFPDLRASTSSLQHTFSNHAADFGFTGNWNKATGSLFEKALADHVGAENTLRLPGTYRGMSVIHNVDPATGLNVMQSPAGDLISGWRLNAQQLWNVLTRGSL